jgi:hypothetical protein
MKGGWQLFSPTLLVEVKGSLLIRWVALYAPASVWRRGEREKHVCTRSPCLAGLGRVGYGVARQGDGRRHKTCALIVHQNPAQSLTGPQLPFVVYFCYESVSNTF